MVLVSFYDDIILLACVKWVKTLKWQQRMEGNVRSNCRDAEIKQLRSPHSVQRSSSASPALCRSPPTAVWELDHWWTLRSALCLWMTSLRAVHVEFPHLSPSSNMGFSTQNGTGYLMFLQKHFVLSVHLLDLEGWEQWPSLFPTTSRQGQGPQVAPCHERCRGWASQAWGRL